jgi:hypothetical protein
VVDARSPAPSPRTRVGAIAGLTAALAGAAAVGVLHVVPPSADLNPVRRTISEYALLETGWVFDTAVLALAAGSAAVLVALVRTGLLRPVGGGSVALTLWCAGLTGAVVFPKHNWAVGPSLHGDLHRVASLVGFLSLPLAALLIGWAWRTHDRWRPHAYVSFLLGSLSLLSFTPIAYAILSQPITGLRWWQAVPLGAVERLLAGCEVATVVCLGWWAVRAAGTVTVPASPDRVSVP